MSVAAARVDGGHGAPTRRRWAVPVAVFGLLVTGVAGYAITSGGGDSDSSAAAGAGPALTTSAVDRPTILEGANGADLGATLTLPAGAGGDPVPGVLIIPGGRTLDRNSLIGMEGGVPNPLYEDIALSAVGSGMAVLRYDMRGTATSRRPSSEAISFENFVTDARAGLDFLAERREIAGAPLALVAYDNGGLVALRIAASDPRVKAVVLISTTGQPLADYLAADFIANFPADGPAVAAALRAAVVEVQAGRIPPQGSLPPALRDLFPSEPNVAGYLQEIFTLNPAAEARGVTAPVLLMRGGLDTSISDLDVAALQGALGGPVEIMVGPEADHTLMLPVSHGAVVHEGATETPRDAALMTRMGEWLSARLSAA